MWAERHLSVMNNDLYWKGGMINEPPTSDAGAMVQHDCGVWSLRVIPNWEGWRMCSNVNYCVCVCAPVWGQFVWEEKRKTSSKPSQWKIKVVTAIFWRGRNRRSFIIRTLKEVDNIYSLLSQMKRELKLFIWDDTLMWERSRSALRDNVASKFFPSFVFVLVSVHFPLSARLIITH